MCSQGHKQGARVQPQYHGQVMSQAYFLSFRSGPHNFDSTAVAEFWKNVWSYQVKIFFEKTKSTTPCVISSSAGAGSGEFHLYRKMRRKEQEREEVRNMKFFQVFLQSLIFCVLQVLSHRRHRDDANLAFQVRWEWSLISDHWTLHVGETERQWNRGWRENRKEKVT